MRPVALLVTCLLCLVAASQGIKVAGQANRVLYIRGDENPTQLYNTVDGADILEGSLHIDSAACLYFGASQTFPTFYSLLDNVLSSLKEIRGYVRIEATECLPHLGFLRNLHTIRGYNYFVDKNVPYALIISAGISGSLTGDPDQFVDIGLNSLVAVERNGILMTSDGALCGRGNPSTGAQGADLTALMPGTVVSDVTSNMVREVAKSFSNYTSTLRYRVDKAACPSSFCHTSCNGKCWRRNDDTACQIAVCSTDCGVRGCHADNLAQCCPASCAGGCTGSANTCIACHPGFLRSSDGTACVAECGAAEYRAGLTNVPVAECAGTLSTDTMVFEPYYCTASCQGLAGAFDSDCVFPCPAALTPVNGVCPQVPSGNTDVVCERIYGVRDSCQLEVIRKQDCNTLVGSFYITRTNDLQFATEAQLAFLQKLRRITEFVYVDGTSFDSLSFLKNLEEINGQRLTGGRALRVRSNYVMRSLGLESLRLIGAGGVSFEDNFFMCLHNTINYTRLAGRELQPQYLWTKTVIENLFDDLLSPYDYFAFLAGEVHPAACNGLECDPICGGHCWDEGVPGCQRCPAGQVLTAGECLLPEDIPNGFYRDDWLARPCRESCASCDGPNDDSCLSCSGTRYLLALPGSSGSCVTNCGQGFYSGSGNVCRRCHVSCTQCYGPSSDACTACSLNVTSAEIFFKSDGSDSCVAECDQGEFGDFFSRTCKACQSNCLECTSARSCDRCATGFFLTQAGTCKKLTECTLGTSFETLAPTDTSDRVCSPTTVCAPNEEYATVPATLTSDRNCSTCRTCDTTFQVRRPGTCSGENDAECELIDRCFGNPCQNNGNCTNDGGRRFLCKCDGFCGPSCEVAFVSGRCPTTVGGSTGSSNSAATLGAAVGCVVIVLIVIAIAVILVRRSHRKARPGEVSAMTMARFRNRRAHAEPDEWEIDRELLIFTDRKLGSGHFGQVVFAALQDPMTGMGREVAVKQIVNADEGSKEEREFVKEMSLMKALAGSKEAGQPAPEPYPFVVGLLGVCTLNEPLLLVLDYADQGDLAHYLKDKRPKRGARTTQADVKMLLTFAAQCACGMDFLERHRVVHRDLAARNVLVNGKKNPVCKISDFGMSRDLAAQDDDVYIMSNEDGVMPLKWVAIESIASRQFTHSSDYWSFGILLWEIMSWGSSPYPNMDVHEVVPQIRKGYRMGAPDACPPDVYQLMLQCWAETPRDRPGFAFLRAVLIELSGQPSSAFEATGGARPPSSTRPSSASMSVYLQPTPVGTLTGSIAPYKYDNPVFSSSYEGYENSGDFAGGQPAYDNPILSAPTYHGNGTLTQARDGSSDAQYDVGNADDADELPNMADYGLAEEPAPQENNYRLVDEPRDHPHGSEDAEDHENVYRMAGGVQAGSTVPSANGSYLDVGDAGEGEVMGF